MSNGDETHAAITGLTAEEAEARLDRFGPNEPAATQHHSFLCRSAACVDESADTDPGNCRNCIRHFWAMRWMRESSAPLFC